MSNSDTFKQGYEAFGRGDLDGATEYFADVWRFSDGKVTEVQALTDTALAADALGTA